MPTKRDTAHQDSPPGADPRDEAPRHPATNLRLEKTPGHLLRRAQQRAIEIYQHEVGENGLRPPQFALMLTVYQNPGINQTELVKITGVDRSTVADTITRLEKRGLIKRKPGKDQRARRLWVTKAGADAVDRDIVGGQRAQELIMAPIPDADRERFLELLRQIADLPA
jgi:DNA-binding MarR family transcriptional regulator